MPLRKSPTLTPASLAARRQNSKKSTGPRTFRGIAWSCLNNMRNGGRLRQGRNLLKAMVDAPPGQVAAIAQAILASMPAVHNVFIKLAELGIQAEIDTCAEFRRMRGQGRGEEEFFFGYVRSWNVIENK